MQKATRQPFEQSVPEGVKLEALRAQGREFPVGPGLFLRRKELTLEGKKSDWQNRALKLFQEASKDDAVYVLIMHFLQNLSISNSFVRVTVNDEM